MAWTAPRTWVTGEVLSSTLLNTHLRDNLLMVDPSARGTSLPAAPADFQVYYYAADAANGIVWTLKYNAGSASAFKWENIGSTPMLAEINTSESTSSTTPVDLATVGPSLTAPRAGEYDATVIAQMLTTAPSFNAYAGIKVGAGAFDASAAAVELLSTNGGIMTGSHTTKKTAAAADVIKVQYQNSVGVAATYQARRLRLLPIRVS